MAINIPPMGYAIGGTLLITLIIGIVFFIRNMFFNSKKEGYTFYLWNRSGTRAEIIKGNIRFNPDNKKEKQFFFSAYNQVLSVKPATVHVGKEAVREITFDEEGNFVYLEGTEINDEKFKKKALQPEEKQITLHRLRENERRNRNPMNKYQTITLLMGIITIFLVFVGTIVSIVVQTNAAKVNLEAAKVDKEVMEASRQVANSNKEVAEQLASIAAALTGEHNITRTLS